MIQIIRPKGQPAHQRQVAAFLDLLKIYHNFHLSSEIKQNATFMIAEDDKRGIYGGAVLYPQKNDYLNFKSEDKDEAYLEYIASAFQSRRKEIWMARICFCVGQDSSSPSVEILELCESFYKNLYQELTIFKKKKRAGLITFILRLADVYKTDALQKWSVVYEIKLKEKSDGFLYGILDLPLRDRSADNDTYKVLDFSSKAGRIPA